MSDHQSQAVQVWQNTLTTIFETEKLNEAHDVMSFVFMLFAKAVTVFSSQVYEAAAIMCRDVLEGASYLYTHRIRQRSREGHLSWAIIEPKRGRNGSFMIEPLSEHMKKTMRILPGISR